MAVWLHRFSSFAFNAIIDTVHLDLDLSTESCAHTHGSYCFNTDWLTELMRYWYRVNTFLTIDSKIWLRLVGLRSIGSLGLGLGILLSIFRKVLTIDIAVTNERVHWGNCGFVLCRRCSQWTKWLTRSRLQEQCRSLRGRTWRWKWLKTWVSSTCGNWQLLSCSISQLTFTQYQTFSCWTNQLTDQWHELNMFYLWNSVSSLRYKMFVQLVVLRKHSVTDFCLPVLPPV